MAHDVEEEDTTGGGKVVVAPLYEEVLPMTPVKPVEVQTSQSTNSRKMKLLKEEYKKRYADCRTEKAVLEIKHQELFKMIGDATYVPETGGLIIKPKCKDWEDHAQACPDDGDEHKLECKQCKKLFHYSCAGVPVFQLSHFLTSGYRKFICKRCTVIPDYIKEIMAAHLVPEQNTTSTTTTGVQTKFEDNNELQNESELKCKEYQDQIKKMETELSVLKNSDSALRTLLDERERELDKLQEKFHEKETELQREKDEKVKHQTEGRQLKGRIEGLQEDVTQHERKLRLQGGIIQKMRLKEKSCEGTQNKEVAKGCANPSAVTIDAKLEAFSDGILTKVTELMEKKFEILKGDIPHLSKPPAQEGPQQPSNAWSTIVSQPADMKAVMRDARNEEKLEESEKQKRARNIIIHGAEEIGKSPEEVKKGDLEYIKEIFAKIGAEAEPAAIMRLGEAKKENEPRCRPIKIVMKSNTDKDIVMKNLGRLKGTERYFGKISVKDDYTSNERQQIRMLTQQAIKQTEESPDKSFKVRGNSKNGWHIVSFPKK